jgi:hypothetical protein
MAEAALFLGWNRPFQNRESEAFDVLQAMGNYLNGLKNSGQIASWTRVWLEPHGGDLNGFLIIEGDVPKLQAIKQTDAWNDLVAKMSLVIDGLGVNHAIVGDAAAGEVERMRKLLRH